MKHLFFITTILALYLKPAYSQTETMTLAECEVDTTENQYDKLLKYFIVDNEEVRRLWKFNTVDWGTLNPSIGLEQKIGKKSSLEAELKLFSRRYSHYNNSLTISNDEITGYYHPRAELLLDYRFYYNQNRRIHKGKTTNGFSGNYLFLGTSIGGGYIGYSELLDNPGSTTPTYRHTGSLTATYRAQAGYGIQRRLGNIGYVDLKCGVLAHTYRPERKPEFNGVVGFSPFIDVNLGFGLKSLKRPFIK